MQQRKPVRRAFIGLAGRFLPDDTPAPEAVPEVVPEATPAPAPAPVQKKKRGRPLTGTTKKTAAEIKRDQRKREKELLESVRLSQQQQNILDDAVRRIEAELADALNRGDFEKAREIGDIIRGQQEQIEYNAQIASAKKPRAGGGMFIADAPQGKGKIIFDSEAVNAVEKNATIDADGDATFQKSQKITAYKDRDGGIVNSDYAPGRGVTEYEDQFHEDHPIKKGRRDPSRSEFDEREQEEKVFSQAPNFMTRVAVAVLSWFEGQFYVIRNADEDLKCKLCGQSFWSWRAAREHLVDHKRTVAPTSTKRSRENQKLVNAALAESEAKAVAEAKKNRWVKRGGRWERAN